MRISLRLLALTCIFGVGAGVARAQNQSDDDMSAQVDEVVRAQMREQSIPGVSLAVVRNGKIIKATGYGLANVELDVPVTPKMVFNPGSLAKAFTATAVMMLVEEGKVGLDDKISKYLPEAPAAWNEITIRRLLTHTSGLRDYFGEDGDPKFDFHQDCTEDELVRKFGAQTMRFPPGEQWRYNNAGYVVLGVVIHRVTGKFWFDFVKERIFDPLGMTSTRLLSTDDIISNRASGYQMVNGQRKNAPWLAPSWLTTADGSLYTNVFDMAKWDAALYTEKLIKRSTLEQMWTPVKLNNGTAYPYGFAWRISDVNGHRLIQHDGVDYAFTSRFARYVNDGLSVIVFMNLGEDDEAAMPKRMTDNVAAIYIPALGKVNGHAPLAAAPQETGQSTTSNQRTTQRLSPQQKDVWNGEQDSFRYLNAKDLKAYMSMWDANFVGWPDYYDRPVRKGDIESSAVEEFRSSQTPSQPLPAPQPEAVVVFGNVAVTHYFWPEVDQTSPTIYRITHTWQKGRDGWHIIGGMSCPVPRSAVSPSDEKRAVEMTIRSFEGALQEYDFTKADTFYAAEAKWIEGAERTYPELAYPTGQGPFWTGVKANKVQLVQDLHDFDIQIRGDVAWATMINDTTWTANNEEGRKLLAESELEETGRTSPPNQHEWRSSYVESEVLVKMPAGWKLALGHTSLLPPSATGSGQSSKSQVATSTVPPEPDVQPTSASQSVEAKVLELDRAWGQAYVKGDIDVIDRTLAPDWRGWLDTEGSDKATELAEFRAGKNRSLENIIDNSHVRVYGNTAIVEARERVRFRDETGEHWLTWHITDVFVKQVGQWQVVASHGSTIPNP
jgi:CubicO group peptidase (beta-lactamase class C family)/ketosteroid isomerase-like protein